MLAPGTESAVTVTTASTPAKALSIPRRNSVKNSSLTQTIIPGNVAKTTGYAPNNRLGPDTAMSSTSTPSMKAKCPRPANTAKPAMNEKRLLDIDMMIEF